MSDWNQGRRLERVTRDWVALYSDADGSTFRNPVADLSLDGTFLTTSRPLQPGTTLDVVLLGRDLKKHVRVPAQVVWRGRKAHRGMGLTFLHGEGTKGALESAMG